MTDFTAAADCLVTPERRAACRSDYAAAQIALENVSKHYETEKALHNVSLSFADDVTTAVVGPSGSGKSTLLQLINGLVRPEQGRVLVFGKPIDYEHLPELRRQIGYAVQGTGLFPHLTVEGNITLLAKLAGWDRDWIKARTEALMRRVDLPLTYARRYPYELSGGQQQRVGLCRAMMLNPRIFLLDEPFGALDPMTRCEIHHEFLHLQQSESRTIVLVTHDLREALKLAQRLVVLDKGRVVQEGLCLEIVNKPANEFVRGFFRSQLQD
jgi:osmoprotectant transport system ATP-binding protein